MQYNELGNTGIKVSHVSLGGAAFSNIYGAYDEERSLALIREALRSGVNYLETGPWYGQGCSERTIGKALVGIPRDSYFIGSKVGRYELTTEKMFDFSAEKTEAAVDNTLRLLGLDYVDIIQIHDLSFAPEPSVVLRETLPALRRAVRDGKARHIGLADYDLDLLRDVVDEADGAVATVLSYAKSTLLDNRLQNYVGFFKERRVGVINAAATGMGLLTDAGPPPWHPADDRLKAACRDAALYCRGEGVELASVATRWSLSQPGVATHVCGVRDVAQLRDVLRADPTPAEVRALAHLRGFFGEAPLHWDGVEVAKYRTKLSAVGARSAASS